MHHKCHVTMHFRKHRQATTKLNLQIQPYHYYLQPLNLHTAHFRQRVLHFSAFIYSSTHKFATVTLIKPITFTIITWPSQLSTPEVSRISKACEPTYTESPL